MRIQGTKDFRLAILSEQQIPVRENSIHVRFSTTDQAALMLNLCMSFAKL